MFTLEIDRWNQVKNMKISTTHTAIELKEEEGFVVYNLSEYGHWESAEYKFRLKKRQDYKEYTKRFAEVDVDEVDLKSLTGVAAFFREVYQHAVSLFRRGVIADITFKWRDRDILITFSLHAAKGEEWTEVQSRITAQLGDEFVDLIHGEKSVDAEEDLERHTKDAVGLYLLFKEYVLQEGEPGKT
jgi:hypothetical protein